MVGSVAFRRALLGASSAVALLGSGAAVAQTVTTAPATQTQAPTSLATPGASQPTGGTVGAPSPAPTQAQEVVVTGSLFRRTNTETPSPVTLLTANQLAKEGITNISDAVRSISADNSGTIPNAFGIGFAAGASGVSLRGLTAADTLVLIDGLRTVDYPIADDGVRNFVDLNTIPESVLDRVEVLKDGASSIYGSDAVAGVVNIITKPSYKGFEADAAYGDSQHGGGNEFKAYALGGVGDLGTDGYNAYVDFEYQNDNKISVGQRGFPFNTNDLSSIGGFNGIGGQPGLDSGSIYGSVTRGKLGTPGNLTSGVPVRGGVAQILNPNGCGPAGTPTTDATGTYCSQNFTNYGDDQPQEERWGVFGRFTKQLGRDNQFFTDVYYYENKLAVNAAPGQIQSSAPLNTNGIALPPTITVNGVTEVNPNDPFVQGLTVAQAQRSTNRYALLNYAFGDIPNETTLDNHVIRGVAGMKGKLFGFDYEADATIAHSAVDTVDRGLINYDQLVTDINDGAYSFINPASNSAAVRSALSPALSKTSTSDLDSLDFHISRNIFELPGGPLALALGAQARYEAISDPGLNVLNTDGTATPTSVLGLGLAETQGHRDVEAFYFEVDAH